MNDVALLIALFWISLWPAGRFMVYILNAIKQLGWVNTWNMHRVGRPVLLINMIAFTYIAWEVI